MSRLYADDIVIGRTYLTWGGALLTVTGFRAGEYWWRDAAGNAGATRVKAFLSRVRKEASTDTG